MAEAITYERRRPEATTLYEVVRDNLETLYGAVDDGAVKLALPRFVRKELEGYLDCGLLCRGFARMRCDGCAETRLVAFACKGRGFCPSCLGRKMSATAANTFAVDVLCCPRCSGRLRLVAVMTEPKEIRRYLRALGEPTETPDRSPARGPPYWGSRALRRRAGEVDAA